MKYLFFVVAILAMTSSCSKEANTVDSAGKHFPLFDAFDASNHILVHSSSINGELAGISIKGRMTLGNEKLQEVEKFSINGELLEPDSKNRYLKTFSSSNTNNFQAIKESFLDKDINVSLSDNGKNIVDVKVFNPRLPKASFSQDLRHVSRKKHLVVRWNSSVSLRENEKIGVYIAQRGTTSGDIPSKVYHLDYFDDNGTYQVPMDILNQYPLNSKVDILFAKGNQISVDGETYVLGVNVVSTDLYKILITE